MPINDDIPLPYKRSQIAESPLLLDEAHRLTEAGKRYIDKRLDFGDLLEQCLPIAGAIYAQMHPAAQRYVDERYALAMDQIRRSPIKSWFFKAEESFKTVRWNGMRHIVVPNGYYYSEDQPKSYNPGLVLLTLSSYEEILKAGEFDNALKEERESVHHPSLLNTAITHALKTANGDSEILREHLHRRRWLVDYESDYEKLLAKVIARNRNP